MLRRFRLAVLYAPRAGAATCGRRAVRDTKPGFDSQQMRPHQGGVVRALAVGQAWINTSIDNR